MSERANLISEPKPATAAPPRPTAAAMPRPEAFRKAFGLLAGKRLAGAAIEEVLLGHETVKQNRRVPRRRAAVYGTPTLPRRAVTPSRITSMRLALQRRAKATAPRRKFITRHVDAPRIAPPRRCNRRADPRAPSSFAHRAAASTPSRSQ